MLLGRDVRARLSDLSGYVHAIYPSKLWCMDEYVYESECGAKLSPVLLLSVSDMSVALFSPPPKFDFYVACPLDVVFPHDLLRNDFPRAMKKVKEGRENFSSSL